MHDSVTSAQVRARIGGLTRAATAPTRQAITEAARQGRTDKRRAKILAACPDLTDEADIQRRMDLLERAEMTAMSLKAAKARRLKAEAEAIEAELNASGLLDSGSDGTDR